MDKETLRRLESLNQLALTEEEKSAFLSFYDKQESALSELNSVNTDNTERMVHVMPLENVLREDVVIKNFTRDELQKGAPETFDGYWQVPRVVE